MPNPYGQIVDTSHSGGLRIREYWSKLFRENEVAWQAGLLHAILIDEEITAEMYRAFPSHNYSVVFKRLGRVRAEYNRGAWTKGVKPVFRSFRYKRTAATVQRISGQNILHGEKPLIVPTRDEDQKARA
jgi:hypothetical protein